MTYTITARRQFTYLGQPLFYILLFSIISYILFNGTGYAIFGVLFIVVVDSLPVAILHIQYLLKNNHSKLVFDRSKNQISYAKGNDHLSYDFENIQHVIKVYSSTNGYSIGKNSFRKYFYYKLIFNDGVELIVTCLLADDLEIILIPIYHKEIEKRFRIFPSVV